jgi:transposase-like protein
MAAQTQQDTHERMVQITREYMGVAAERFIDRQIRSHLHKEPHAVTTDDIPVLIDWIQLAISHLTNDSQVIQEYTDRLKQLAQKKPSE